MEFRWKIRSMLEKYKSCRTNMIMKELKAVKSSRLNKDIRILQADKANCTVMFDESKYKKSLTLCRCLGFINPSQRILQLKLRGKYRNSFPSTKLLSLLDDGKSPKAQ
jgi:hypothetical protein